MSTLAITLISYCLKFCVGMHFDNLVMDHKGMIKWQNEDLKLII